VVISDRVWRQRFAASPDVLGQIVRINMEPAEIIGVMPVGFAFPFVSDVWTAARDATGQPETQQRDAEVIARLKPGASLDEAALELQTVWPRLQQQSPETRRDVTLAAPPASFHSSTRIRAPSSAFCSRAALSVLLVACAIAGTRAAQPAQP
jgi:hypothetical protein